MLKHRSFSRQFELILRLRNRHFVLLDIMILCITPALALLMRVDYPPSASHWQGIALYTAIALLIRMAVFVALGLYTRYWRYASIDEMVQIAVAVAVSTTAIVVLFFAARLPALDICPRYPAACSLPRSIPFIDALLVLLAVGGVRFSVRLADLLQQQRADQGAKRILIMGAGEAGAMIVKEMRSNPQLGLLPVAFLDDDPRKQAVRIRGLPVLGTRQDIPRMVRERQADEVIIAMPTAAGKEIREVMRICAQVGVQARTIPGMYELLDGTVRINQLRPVEIEDLLRREPVVVDNAALHQLIQGRRVAVTGGGGSIGSELCRQVLRYDPAELLILGHGENSVFEIYQELRHWESTRHVHHRPGAGQSTIITPLIVDIRFAQRMLALFQQHRPEIVFHAAAHKHVPLMEQNPAEAITNNVLGTRNVLEAALAAGVERFVMISTDKAVNPTSIMGASKRAAELLVQQAARSSQWPYVAVRFGNVLGSRGSVVLTFKKQIALGGPVTVTHPEMRRYFMTIPEAVQLVLQAAALGCGGEVFMLDMGEPVRIVDLAQDLIRLSGLEVGRDIDIVFTGMRPGEKLYEELFVDGETYQRTRHEKIYTAANTATAIPVDLSAAIAGLEMSAQRNDNAAIWRGLKGLVPEFQPPGDVVVIETRQPDASGNGAPNGLPLSSVGAGA